jgi:hypothetical protein
MRRILEVMADHGCAIYKSFHYRELISASGQHLKPISTHTWQTFQKHRWVEMDPEAVDHWRISERGRAALQAKSRSHRPPSEIFAVSTPEGGVALHMSMTLNTPATTKTLTAAEALELANSLIDASHAAETRRAEDKGLKIVEAEGGTSA